MTGNTKAAGGTAAIAKQKTNFDDSNHTAPRRSRQAQTADLPRRHPEFVVEYGIYFYHLRRAAVAGNDQARRILCRFETAARLADRAEGWKI